MEEEKKIMKFSVIEKTEPRIPVYTEPNTPAGKPVPWGERNDFPNFVNMLYNESSTLRAIIDGSVKFICGNGLSISDEAAKWRDEINRRGETLEDLIEGVGLDLLKFNGFAIQVIYSKLGEVKELYALDFGRIRLSSDGKKVFYAKKWGSYTNKYDEYDAFDRSRINVENPTQIFVYKSTAKTIYPMPTYQGSFKDALSDIAASEYTLNNLENGLAARTIITIPDTDGMLTEDEKKDIEKSIQARFCGPRADSKFFLYFKQIEGSDMKVDSIQVEDESEKFNRIREAARDNLFISFRAIPGLFGLPNKNNGFTQQEFAEAFALYQKCQVSGWQRKIEKAIEKIINTKGAITILPFSLENVNQE